MSDEPNSKPSTPAEPGDKAQQAAGAEPEPSHAVGDIVCGLYRIEEIGSDAADRLAYRALHLERESLHIVRPIGAELAGDESAMEQLVREAGLLRYLEHEAVADYEGVLNDESGQAYLIMESVEGPSLASVMSRGALEPETVLELRDRLGRGLMAAHDYGLVHRELRPENVILENGEMAKAKIVGFGLIQSAALEVKSIETEASAEAFAYLAPEQLGLYGGRVDARTDIYSLGLLLAAAALGRALDQDKTMVQLLKDRQSPPDLSGLPDPLRAELEVLLQPDPKDRPSSLGDLIVAEEAASMAARLAPQADAKAVSKQPSGARGWLLAGGVIAVIAVIGLGSQVFFEQAPEEAEPEQLAATDSETAEAEAPAQEQEQATVQEEPAEAEATAEPAPEPEPQAEPAAQEPEPEPQVAEAAPAETEVSEPAEAPAEESAAAEETPATEPEPEAQESEAQESETAATGEVETAEEEAPAAPEASEQVSAEQEGLLPPPKLPTSLQDVVEEATPSEPAAEAEGEVEASETETAEAADETEPEASEPEAEAEAAPAEPVEPAEPEATAEAEAAEPEMAEAEATEAEEAPEQVAALPPAESESPVPGPDELFDADLDDGQRRQVQQALKTLGYYDGVVDGIFGPGTRGGVAAYQRSIGAEADGFVDDRLLTRLADIARRTAPQQTAAVSTRRVSLQRQPSLADTLRAQQPKAEPDSILGNDFEWLMRRALSGDSASQSLLASRYQRGKGAPLNLPEAAKWYRLAAEQGDPKGQYNLGLLYEAGEGVPQDYDEAAAWFARAAQQNEPGAREKLDSLYSRGLAEPPS